MTVGNDFKMKILNILSALLLLGLPSSVLCCEPWEFRCDNGNCVKGQAKCTDQPFCSDGSDKRHCPESAATPPPCQPNKFQCDNGLCINFNWVCDKRDDCGDSSDERACPTKGSSVLTQASVIGLSVAVVGLFAILVGIIFMVTCARRKIERERLERRRQIAEQHHDMMGPYGGYMVGPGMTMREPPPRYSSQPDLSVSTSSYSPYPLCEVPPPLYTAVDKPAASRPNYHEPPPTYTSYPDLRSALVESRMDRSDSVVSQGLDNPGLEILEDSLEIVKSEDKSSQNDVKDSSLSRAGTCHDLSTANHPSSTDVKTSVPMHYSSKADLEFKGSNGALAQTALSHQKKRSETSTSRRSSAHSLYEGLTTADRDLLQNIMMTVPAEVLRRRGSLENAQSTVDLRPPRVTKDQYKSEPAVYQKRNEQTTSQNLNHPSYQRKLKSQAKSYSHLEMVHNLPPLRHAVSQDTRYLSSSELANPWNTEALQSPDFQTVQPVCVSTPKQTSPRRLQMCSDISISQDSLDIVEMDDNRNDQQDFHHSQGASVC